MENKYKTYKKNYKKSKGNKSKQKKEQKKVSSIDLLEKRIIYLDDEIDDKCAKDIISSLLKLDMCNHKDITMYINSGGGSVSAGLSIYDTMNLIKSDIKTICIGRCASMASILLINGAKGKRYALPNSEVMIHEVSSGTFGKITEMSDKLEHSKKLNERLMKIIASKTKKTMKELKRDVVNKDTWMNANEALKYGFVDAILK